MKQELVEAGYNAKALKDAGFKLPELKAMGKLDRPPLACEQHQPL